MPGKTIHTVVIVGSGNLAFHLGDAFKQAGKSILAVVARNASEGDRLAKKLDAVYYSSFQDFPKADLIVLAVSDVSIAAVADSLPQSDSIVVHISGTTSIDVLQRFDQHGVFYPLQSFTKGKAVDFSQLPLLIEGNNEAVKDVLVALAKEISTKIYPASSQDRKYLHLAAVFAANFSNALYGVANTILTQNTNLPFDILFPLINETAAKLEQLSPREAQTGPARRGDETTINAQLDLLKGQPELQNLYKTLTALIQHTHA